MREAAQFLWVSLVLVAACGGSGSDHIDAGGVDACANLACLQQMQDLMVACRGGGCIAQPDPTALVNATCFANGVKIMASYETSTGPTERTATSTYRLKKDEAACYTRIQLEHDMPGGEFVREDVTTQDGAGTTLVTAVVDPSGAITVTCPGRPPTEWIASCGWMSFFATGPYIVESDLPNCADQTCTY